MLLRVRSREQTNTLLSGYTLQYNTDEYNHSNGTLVECKRRWEETNLLALDGYMALPVKHNKDIQGHEDIASLQLRPLPIIT